MDGARGALEVTGSATAVADNADSEAAAAAATRGLLQRLFESAARLMLECGSKRGEVEEATGERRGGQDTATFEAAVADAG